MRIGIVGSIRHPTVGGEFTVLESLVQTLETTKTDHKFTFFAKARDISPICGQGHEALGLETALQAPLGCYIGPVRLLNWNIGSELSRSIWSGS
jgi:hypothetical protein